MTDTTDTSDTESPTEEVPPAQEGQKALDPAIELLREAFDMLEEDLEEERFYVTVRRAYWAAPAGSPARKIADLLIQKLEF